MLEQIQTNIHYNFRQVKLLVLALTHSSYSNEQSGVEGHNERLEFLGDAVLELCVSQLLYREFFDFREGELTALRSKLVSQDSLAALARELMLDKVLLLGRGEEVQGGRTRDALLSDTFEAVLGAVFVDGGFAEAASVVEKIMLPRLPEVSAKQTRGKDSKSRLQELTQKLFQQRPVYALQNSLGPEHAKLFEVILTLPDGQKFTSTGSSMKKAEQAVAALALQYLQAK